MMGRILLAVFVGILVYLLARLFLNEVWSSALGVVTALAVLLGDRPFRDV